MSNPLAFKGTYSDWRLVKTRGVVQVVMEVPLSEADAAYQILGGMPQFSQERWFGIAPLKNPPAAKESSKAPAEPQVDKDKHQPAAKRMDWRELQPAAQAGIRCADPVFIAFLKEQYEPYWINYEDAAGTVRDICSVRSRTELNTVHSCRMIWKALDEQFQAWKIKERVGT